MTNVSNIKSSKWVIALSLISLAVSVIFGVIGWKFQTLELGPYFAISMSGFSVVVIVSVLFLYEKVCDVEANIKQDITGLEVTSLSNKTRLLNSLIKKSSMIEAFVSKDVFPSALNQDEKLSNKIRIHLFSSKLKGDQIICQQSPYPATLLAIFLFDQTIDLPSKVILVPNDKKYNDLPWLLHTNTALVAAIYRSYMDVLGRYALVSYDAVNPSWLQDKANMLIQNFVDDWQSLLAQTVHFSTPLDIYKEQISLSEDAKYIHAFDMTDINEWFDVSNLGACLKANIESAKQNSEDGVEGNQRVRRIFLSPSRSYLDDNEDYRKKLIAVIKQHNDNGIGVGLAFQDEMRNKKYIKDFVVYDKKVVWVETVATTRQSGAGYFSTKHQEVEAYMSIFDEVWNYKYPRTPSAEATALLSLQDKQVKQIAIKK